MLRLARFWAATTRQLSFGPKYYKQVPITAYSCQGKRDAAC